MSSGDNNPAYFVKDLTIIIWSFKSTVGWVIVSASHSNPILIIASISTNELAYYTTELFTIVKSLSYRSSGRSVTRGCQQLSPLACVILERRENIFLKQNATVQRCLSVKVDLHVRPNQSDNSTQCDFKFNF